MLESKINLKLPLKNKLFIDKLIHNSYEVEVTGASSKTLRIKRKSLKCAYMNKTIIERGNLIGLYFGKFGGNDACPDDIRHQLKPILTTIFKCNPSCFDIHDGAGKNTGRRFVGINDPAAAWAAVEWAGQEDNDNNDIDLSIE